MSGGVVAADYVTDKAIPKKILIRGELRQVWFREPRDGDYYRYIAMRANPDLEIQAGARAFIISKCLCEPDGTLALTLEQAAALKVRVGKLMVDAIMELVLEEADTAGNELAPGADATGSGTS
jgi:hypothetical protein